MAPEQLAELKAIVRGLQKDAATAGPPRGEVPMSGLLDTGRFDFEKVYNLAAWIDATEHPAEHDSPEDLEYGIETFVCKRPKPFGVDALNEHSYTWPTSIIRARGMP